MCWMSRFRRPSGRLRDGRGSISASRPIRFATVLPRICWPAGWVSVMCRIYWAMRIYPRLKFICTPPSIPALGYAVHLTPCREMRFTEHSGVFYVIHVFFVVNNVERASTANGREYTRMMGNRWRDALRRVRGFDGAKPSRRTFVKRPARSAGRTFAFGFRIDSNFVVFWGFRSEK